MQVTFPQMRVGSWVLILFCLVMVWKLLIIRADLEVEIETGPGNCLASDFCRVFRGM